MADALLEIVIENLGSFVQEQIATFWGVEQHAQKLRSNLTALRAVLNDAEKKQITRRDDAVKDWLQKLTDAAYVLDDILDEYPTQSPHGLSRFHPKAILFRCNIGKRMKDISSRFHHINEERRTFELRSGVTEKHGDDDKDDDWRQTSSIIPAEHIVYGRDQDRETIVEFLLGHSDEEDLCIYPIVGMGGLGKTTLARQIFNDGRVCKRFDLTIWVCVSDDFNAKTILQSIVESVTGQNPNLKTLEAMQKKVQEVLQSKRYLLVLDDVWNEDPEKWKTLKGMLQCAGGTKGATILVTTRLPQAASIMETQPAHHLIGLSEDDGWSLFKHHAFGTNREEREELAAIGKEIVKKCVGSPLAIKTLGSLLRDEIEVTRWENIRGSEFWNIREETSISGEQNSIMRALKLSYFNLDLTLRRCFSFCAIFPKDSEIVKEDLIHLWMANGFIKTEGNLEVEDVGNKVWKKLYHRSFFQEAKSDECGIITSFKMHDLFHDLAQSIMGEECVVHEHTSLTHLSGRVHHLLLLGFNTSVNMSAFKKVESLRTLLDFGYTSQLPSNRHLRALCTRSHLISPLKDLAHLRYLNLHGFYPRTSLPSFICGLKKLQTLKLEYFHSPNLLPKNLTQLQDLRHIVMNDCSPLEKMPLNIGKLNHLRTLSYFTVGSKPGYGLGELHDLKLGGKLHITCLENVPSESDATQANLISKKELNRLILSWSGNADSDGINVNPERVLEALELPSSLKSFEMNEYRGTQLPNWMRNPSVLKELVEVRLNNCVNCEQLPPFGKLPHLKSLSVCGMKNVECIDGDSYDGVEKAFPSLEKFSAEGLPNLKRMLRDEGVEMLPRLSRITIEGVSNVKFPRLPSAEHLHASDVEDADSFMEGVVGKMPCLKTLNMLFFNKLKVLPDQLSSQGVLQVLTISHCDELEYFPEHVLQGLTSLRYLEIKRCRKLKSISEGVGHLACLERFSIGSCPELVALASNMNQLTALRVVSIWGGSMLPEGLQRIPSLRTLEIVGCSCSSLPDWLGDITSLRELRIERCRELRSLPSSFQRLTNLCKLTIDGCPLLEKRCKKGTGEDWQYIAHIPELDLRFPPKPTKPTFLERIQRSCS